MPTFPGPGPASQESPSALDEALGFVVEVSRRLNAPLGYDGVVRVAATAPIGTFADIVVLFLDEGGTAPRIETGHRHRGREGSTRELLVQHFELLCAAAATAQARRGPAQIVWSPTLDDRALRRLSADTPELRRLVRALDLQSLIVLPLTAQGRTLGILGMGRLTQSEPFGAAQLAAARVFAQRVGAALETARLQQHVLREDTLRAEAEESVRRWAHAFHSAGWGAALADAEGRLEAVNAEFARIHGYAGPDQMRGMQLSEIEQPSDDQASELDPHDGPRECVHRRADGSSVWVLLTATPMCGGTGNVLHYAISVQDLSAIKRTEYRLRHAQRMEAVGRLAGGVAHEVNNMMTIVLGFGDLVLKAPDVSAEHRQEIEEMCNAALRAARITQQLLAYSRQQILQPIVVDFSAAVASTSHAIHPLLPADVRLETRFVPRPGVGVRIDRTQLEQVVVNLAMNARDAMPDGGTLTLTTDSAYISDDFGPRFLGIPIPPGRYALLSVGDTGRGMDAETRARIFEPFFTTKDVGQGTGLGLATVYGVVKQSDGYIWVDSTPGGGTVFTICFPEVALEAAAPSAELPADTEPPPDPDHSCAAATVLVVEDEPMVRALVRRLLQHQGCRVIEAESGAEALQLTDDLEGELGLVVTDVVMPEVGGRELVERLRHRFPDLPVIYMSGYAHDEVVRRGVMEAGALFLKKPFSARDLLEQVTEALASARR